MQQFTSVLSHCAYEVNTGLSLDCTHTIYYDNIKSDVFRHTFFMGIFRPALFSLVLSVFVYITSFPSIVKVAVISLKKSVA